MAAKEKKTEVRAERVDTKCGSIGHMTVDEIKRRTLGGDVNVTCPECGEIHLTAEDVEAAIQKKITETDKYHKIKSNAVASSSKSKK